MNFLVTVSSGSEESSKCGCLNFNLKRLLATTSIKNNWCRSGLLRKICTGFLKRKW